MSTYLCRACIQQVPRSQRRSHSAKPPLPAPQPRKCANPTRDCPNVFTPPSRHPTQIYCSKEPCRSEADAHQRAERHEDAGRYPDAVTKAELDMAPIRKREAEQAAEMARTDAAILKAYETKHNRWLSLLEVKHG